MSKSIYNTSGRRFEVTSRPMPEADLVSFSYREIGEDGKGTGLKGEFVLTAKDAKYDSSVFEELLNIIHYQKKMDSVLKEALK